MAEARIVNDDSSVTRQDYDVIVVGAGFAGAAAARELTAKGLKTLVLEARHRLGGRTWTDTFAGQSVELGGQFVSPAHPLVMDAMRRYGIGTVSAPAVTRAVMPTPNGPGNFTIEELVARQGGLLDKLFEGSEEYFPNPGEPLTREDLVAKVDHLSLRDRIEELQLSQDDQNWITGITAGQSGGSSSFGALTALAQWWALAGWDPAKWYTSQSLRPAGGMSAFIKALIDDSKATVCLNTPVRAVSQDADRVTVTAGLGQSYTAKTVVMAVPLNVWRTIKFLPGLPEVHATATEQGVGVPNVRKLWLHVRGVPDDVTVSGVEGDQLVTVISQGRLDDGQLMFAINALPVLDIRDRSAVEVALKEVLPEATLVDFRAQDWGSDPYALGAWALRKPNQLTAQLPEIQQPHGRIAFATSDIASGWIGFVEGAFESGLRAAEQAAAIVG
ncbi:NAD(P)/FAD-dependent oxidoreductase [Saccharopolyspora hirsuta]|uniref:FAD-dependent oxidoreductase n=1 Tax=Saccharopolyspora hirsuta TaxID=1837 RepID=A0A5M7BZQ8_SACHI|nr:NAD(P)/FAD-dependent oxidoreductase [Saccharopolyspora hirsuta]KAA5834963.1 FAD-dependent oxidoreductase [Saccharopolyspora hirsuta]